MARNSYESPLCKRYASAEMQRIFSDDVKFITWREFWIALAISEMELGLDISEEQIQEMIDNVENVDYDLAAKYESEVRHDVMAHVLAFGEQCPKAKPIIHLGATSCYVGDNTDIIIMQSATLRIRQALLNAIDKLSAFSEKYKDLPCLAYTHFQAAQPTTLGKRAALWTQDLMFDLDRLDLTFSFLKLLGCKGTTGTQASFLELFNGDHEKVKLLEEKIAQRMKCDFSGSYAISGQTYSRKIDYYVLSVLSGIAQSAYKFSNDIRLMSHLKEIEEPFESGQIGSSAMAYKRNPMRSERIASLARYVTVDALNPALTASAQWFERTLDDSANKRIAVPEAFLATDGILSLVINVAGGMKAYPKVIEKHLTEELPFMATENILMRGVKKGGDRQELHEKIRRYSIEASESVKNGGKNTLIELIAGDEAFKITREEIEALLKPENFIGRAKEQTEEFLTEVKALLETNREFLGEDFKIRV